jgi:P27 family predicted phage terminase small subunit
MGARGPARKPAKLHQDNGTFRPGRHGGPALRVEVPDPPAGLSPGAMAQWHVLGRQLADAGLITALDGLALRLLCESAAEYIEAHEQMREQGYTDTTEKGNRIQNPTVGVRNKLWSQVYTMARQFGMTPSARTGLHAESKQEDDDVATILGFRTA